MDQPIREPLSKPQTELGRMWMRYAHFLEAKVKYWDLLMEMVEEYPTAVIASIAEDGIDGLMMLLINEQESRGKKGK